MLAVVADADVAHASVTDAGVAHAGVADADVADAGVARHLQQHNAAGALEKDMVSCKVIITGVAHQARCALQATSSVKSLRQQCAATGMAVDVWQLQLPLTEQKNQEGISLAVP